MSRQALPQVVTANDLLTGAVVFWTGLGWSRDPAKARRLVDPDDQQAALALAGRDAGTAVGAYLAAVDDGGLARLRERIRASGPTIEHAGRPVEPVRPGNAA